MKILSLFWHSVEAENISTDYFDGSNPTQTVFRDQIKYIIDNFTPISIREFVTISNDNKYLKSYLKPPVLLGFDDGFSNVLKHALPVLQEFQVPATYFVIGKILTDSEYIPWHVEIEHMLRKAKNKKVDYNEDQFDLSSKKERQSLKNKLVTLYKREISESSRQDFLNELCQLVQLDRPKGSVVDEDLRFVSKDELINIDQDSMLTVSSHAMSHRLLANLSYDEQLYELEQSDLFLRRNCSSYFPAISYPNGSFNEYTIEIAKKIYTCAFAVIQGASFKNIYAYPRVGLYNYDIQELEYAISSLRRHLIIPIKRFIRSLR